MAGRIRDDDVALVRERSPVADVIGEYVALRNAGGGSLKGLCPFHDEKTPSFHVTPGRNLWYCFGCAEGGDVFGFVQKIDHLGFTEAVERLAARAGVQLRYEQTGGAAPVRQQGQRARILEANRLAAEFYAEALHSPQARAAREFLAERGFDAEAAGRFGCGYAPEGWDALTSHLLQKGFSQGELVTAGLSKQSSRQTMIDRFHRRLLWPIRDLAGEVLGFGARKLYDDDQGPKYLNTPETPVYKKGNVLFGLDLAKREIAKRRQAVVVEGYTDVMACQLAGVPTAVAACGTAFGAEHIAVLRRLLMDSDVFRGEVIFVFDGDAAGQKAAVRAFDDDQKFTAQTFVAVEPEGRDPCELRQAAGDTAVRDLVARRQPLVEFVLRTVIGRHDLDTAEGRVAAANETIPLVARIKDVSLRDEYARRLAGLIGVDDPNRMVARVRAFKTPTAGNTQGQGRSGAGSHGGAHPGPNAGPNAGPNSRPNAPGAGPNAAQDPAAEAARRVARRQAPPMARPQPVEPARWAEREALKLALQQPQLAAALFDAVDHAAYTHPAYSALRSGIASAGGAVSGTAGPEWAQRVGEQCPTEIVRPLVLELSVEPLRASGEPDARYVNGVIAALQAPATQRRIAEVKSKLQRVNPVEEPDTYRTLFGELVSLEQFSRALREQAMGGLGE